MEEELDLNQLWEDQILKERTLVGVEDDARDGCIRSIIELDHIKRDKAANQEE